MNLWFERTLNIGFHVTILFSFLMILFVFLISKVERKSITNELENIIDEQVPKTLDEVVMFEEKLGRKINWKVVDASAQVLADKSQRSVPSIDSHNESVIRSGMYIIVVLLATTIILYLFFTVCFGLNIKLLPIMGENAVLFVFIGALEAVFFLKVASKYIPVRPDYAASVGIDTLKDDLVALVQQTKPPPIIMR